MFLYGVINFKQMTENGFYFTVFQGKVTIARYVNGSWTMCGNVNTYTDNDFDNIDYNNPVYCL